MTQTFTIGELARLAGLNRSTIRWYERIGLLDAPARSAGNYRLYGADHLARLGFIRRCRDIGFGLETIRALTGLAARPEADCGDIAAIVGTRLSELDRRIESLVALRHELGGLADSCPGGPTLSCRIIGALSASAAMSVDEGVLHQDRVVALRAGR